MHAHVCMRTSVCTRLHAHTLPVESDAHHQAVALLQLLWRVEGLTRGPFLVVAPLSTLGHWQRSIEEWTELRVLLYHGSRESRAIM